MDLLKQYGIFHEKARIHEDILYSLALIRNKVGEQVEKYFYSHGISSAKYNILMAVSYINEGMGLTQVELSKRLLVTTSNITNLVNRLCEEKYITRKQNQTNRRENTIKITARGQELIDKLWPGYQKITKTIVSFLTDKEQHDLKNLLESWFIRLST